MTVLLIIFIKSNKYYKKIDLLWKEKKELSNEIKPFLQDLKQFKIVINF